MDPQTYKILEPISELQPYIRRLFAADSKKDIDQTTYPAPTGYNYMGWIFDGTSHVTINEESFVPSQLNKLHVGGQIQYQEIKIISKGRFGQILAECTATGFYELTGITGAKIYGSPLQLEAFAPQVAAPIDAIFATVKDQPGTQDRISHRINIFQEQLCTLAAKATKVPKYVTQAVQRIEQVDGDIQVNDLAEQLGVSPRQLRRKFKEIVGITPKYFAKVLQMNFALGALYHNNQETLASLALEAGFYDQAHFINVMQQFFGQSPKDFLESSEPVLSIFLGQSRKKAVPNNNF